MTTTRKLTAHGPDHIYLAGLTKGPGAGWAWDGTRLTHPLGITIELAPAAAARVTAAVAAYRPGMVENLSGHELSQRPEAERQQFELIADGWGEDEVGNEHVWRYERSTSPVAGTCEFDTSEVISFTTGRR
jgi:hypothetical protein